MVAGSIDNRAERTVYPLLITREFLQKTMRTHSNSTAKKGDVIHVFSQNGKESLGHVIVTDERADGHPSIGGHECREATPEEVREASKTGNIQYG